MKVRNLIVILFIVVFGFSNAAIIAQSKPEAPGESPTPAKPTDAKFAAVRERIKTNPPFQLGEELSYELRISRFPIYGLIGEMTFKVEDDSPDNSPQKPADDVQNKESEATAQSKDQQSKDQQVSSNESAAVGDKKPVNRGRWKINVDAKAKGILTSIFRIKVEDVFTSYIDKEDFGVVKTDKKIEEGKRRRSMIADFDRAGKKVKFVHTDLNTQKQLEIKEKETLGWVTDIVSGWYVMRAQRYDVGDKFIFPLSDNGETYEIEVEALERENTEIELGKFSTLKLEMKIFGGKFIKRKGNLYLWVTDDERRLPVRAQIKSNFGTVNIALINMKNVKSVETKL